MSTVMQSTGSSPVDLILSRLENVRPAGSGFRADCPLGHKSRGTLSIRTGDDNEARMHCFAECSALDILHAIGLELRDLYPESLSFLPPEKRRKLPPEERQRLRQAAKQCEWKSALSTLQFESRIVVLAGQQIKAGISLDEQDAARLNVAVDRIESAGMVLR
jgi:hypothetical protein